MEQETGTAHVDTPQVQKKRLSIDYLLNPTAARRDGALRSSTGGLPIIGEEKLRDAKGCVVGGGLRPPMRPKNWDKKGATYPLPSWSSPSIAPLRKSSLPSPSDKGSGSGTVLPGIDSLSNFPRNEEKEDAGQTGRDRSTPFRRSRDGSSEELPFIDKSSLETYCQTSDEANFQRDRDENSDKRRRELASSGSHSIYSPLSSPFSSPCPSPSFTSPCPSPSFPTPSHSSPCSSPLPFIQRSPSSPSFGYLYVDNSSQPSFIERGAESDSHPSSPLPRPPSGTTSPFPIRVPAPTISLTRPQDSPKLSPLRPSSASSFQPFSHSAFSPVSSRRRASAPPIDKAGSSSLSSPLANVEKSPATKKRLNEEMQAASNLSSAFESWSLGSSDDDGSPSTQRDTSPVLSARKTKKKKSDSSPEMEVDIISTPTLTRRGNGGRGRRKSSLVAPTPARTLVQERMEESSTEKEEEEEESEGGEEGDDSKRRRATPEQVRILEQVFEMNPLPTAATKKELAKRIGMSHRQIQVWFQNKRARMKRMGHVPKSKDPFVFHHLAVCEDGEFSLKAEGYLPEEVESLLPTNRVKK